MAASRFSSPHANVAGVGAGPAPHQVEGDGSGPRFVETLTLRDGCMLAALVAICLAAWCVANDKWTWKSWSLPTAYTNDPDKADFFANACYVKAAGNWYGLPFIWKTIPELGAPSTGNWNDFPTLDETVQGLQWMLVGVFGLFGGLNASFAVAHVLAAAAMYVAARWYCSNRRWAGLAFGLSTFIFAQSPHHMQVAYVWPVALFPPVWRWAATQDGLKTGTRGFWVAVTVAAITGLHFIYYLNIFCQILLLTAVIQGIRVRSWASVRCGLLVIGAGVVGAGQGAGPSASLPACRVAGSLVRWLRSAGAQRERCWRT